jgi:hypothetical protein
MITIKTIPHSEQNYDTVGDYTFATNGDIEIRVSHMGNLKYEFLIALHELIEAILTKDRGIVDADIVAFDKRFEEMRSSFPDMVGDAEPGFQWNAPYLEEHRFATSIERQVAIELKVEWKDYEEAVNKL